MSIGSLYEYFPHKQALLAALAERHVELAEREIAAVLAKAESLPELLGGLQQAIVSSQRYPSEALALLAKHPRGPLQARAVALRERAAGAIAAALERHGQPRAGVALRAQAVLSVIGELTVQAWLRDPEEYSAFAAQLLEMAVRHCTHRSPPQL